MAYYYIDDALLLPLDVWLSVEEGEKTGVSVYPNPAKNTLTVESKQNLSEVWLMDMLGKRLRGFYSVGAKWQTEVSDLPSGIYLVRCIKENGHISTRKVVVN